MAKKIIIIVFTLGLIYTTTKIPYESMRNMVEGAGVWGPIVYILMFAFLPIGFFPVPVLALVAGVSFGVFWGIVYTEIGSIINCSIMFFMSRYLAKDAVTKYANEKLSDKWKERIFTAKKSRLNQVHLIFRLIPLIPYNIINYVFGLTSMSYKDYIIGFILGALPATIVYINMGDKTLEFGSRDFWIAVGMLVALTIGSLILAKIVEKREEKRDKLVGKKIDDLDVTIKKDGRLEEIEK